MAINRSTTPTEATFSVNCNVVLTGSKRMTPQQQDALMKVGTVRIRITDASDESKVLFDMPAVACAFSTGSVGYKAQGRDCQFTDR